MHAKLLHWALHVVPRKDYNPREKGSTSSDVTEVPESGNDTIALEDWDTWFEIESTESAQNSDRDT